MCISHKDMFNRYLTDPEYYGCNLDFNGAMIWNIRERACFCEEDGVLYTLACFNGAPIFFPPMTPDYRADLTPALEKMAAHAAAEGFPFMVKGLTPAMLRRIDPLFQARYQVCLDRPFFDYVYNTEELIALPGKKFHAKRNHLNQFLLQYPQAEFREYRDEDLAGVLALCDAWAATQEDNEGTEKERRAIENGLRYRRELSLTGGVILIDGAVRAFTLGGLNHAGDMGIVYFEKGDTAYRGIYAAINNLYAKANFAGCRFINRQEDMGMPGLRRAKLSYNPVFLVEKYLLTDTPCPPAADSDRALGQEAGEDSTACAHP